jgi:hypothetical protein
MNIFELALLVLILAVGYFAGQYLGALIGVPGWILGFAVGSGSTVLVYGAIVRWTNGDRANHPAGKPVWKKNMNAEEVAQLIERFLEGQSLYPQEWNDFVDTPQEDPAINVCRKECEELDPLVNRPGEPDPDAVVHLRRFIERLRSSRI